RLWAYLAGVCKKQRIFVHEIGGMEDHLHMLIQIPLTLACNGGDQDQLIPMDGPEFRLAARVRGLRCERVQSGCRCSLYPDARSTPPQDDVRAGIYRPAGGTRHRIRSAVRIRLKIRAAPTALSSFSSCLPTAMPWATLWSRLTALGLMRSVSLHLSQPTL